jgi:hypothetical protein
MATADLYRLASLSTWVSLVALVLSGIALALFFGGAGQFWGPVNDALIVASAITLIPAVVAVLRLAGDRGAPWILVLSIATVAGLVLIAVGQTLLIVGRLSLEGSYVTGGVGVVPVLAWIVVLAVLSLGSGVLPSTTGWLAVATIAGIVVASIIGVLAQGAVLWIAGIGVLVVISGLLASLASSLGTSATSAAAEAAATVATRAPA